MMCLRCNDFRCNRNKKDSLCTSVHTTSRSEGRRVRVRFALCNHRKVVQVKRLVHDRLVLGWPRVARRMLAPLSSTIARYIIWSVACQYHLSARLVVLRLGQSCSHSVGPQCPGFQGNSLKILGRVDDRSRCLQLQSHTNPQLLPVSDQGSPDMLPMISSMTFTASASDAFKSLADSGSILTCLSRANSPAKHLSIMFPCASRGI